MTYTLTINTATATDTIGNSVDITAPYGEIASIIYNPLCNAGL